MSLEINRAALFDGWFHIGLPDSHADCAGLAGVFSGRSEVETDENTQLNHDIPLRSDHSRNLPAARRTGAL